MWGATILFIKNKDGLIWMWIDYLVMNQLTIKINLLPRIDNLFNQLKIVRVLSKID